VPTYRYRLTEDIDCLVAGVTKLNADGRQRQRILWRLYGGEPLRLVREGHNPHDPNAIAVVTPAGQIGYLPREVTAQHAEAVDRGDVRLSAELADVGRTKTEDGRSVWYARLSVRVERLMVVPDPQEPDVPLPVDDADRLDVVSPIEARPATQRSMGEQSIATTSVDEIERIVRDSERQSDRFGGRW